MVLLFLGLMLGALVAIHMARPFLKVRQISAARFFNVLSPVEEKRLRLRFSKPQFSRSFFVRLLILLLLMASVLSIRLNYNLRVPSRGGIWLVVDTSASMSTLQGGRPRMEYAKRVIKKTIKEVRRINPDSTVCYNLSTFDLELRHLLLNKPADVVTQQINELKPRPLGTDLNLIRNRFQSMDESSETKCPITHFLVVSDQPHPAWVVNRNDLQMVWRDISAVVGNIGFTKIQASRNPLTGLIKTVRLTVRAYGTVKPGVRLAIKAFPDRDIQSFSIDFHNSTIWEGMFAPPGPGRYHLHLTPGGAYRYDDEAVIDITDGQTIRVDWQLNTQKLPMQLGWEVQPDKPHLRVVRQLKGGDQLPTLVVDAGYGPATTPQTEIFYFDEASPILADLNLDVIESLSIPGVESFVGFEPVLSGLDNRVWIARRENPPAVVIPGLPANTDDNLGTVSATIFFNAVRWLLKVRPMPEIYTLTSPAQPQIDGSRLALHDGEGNTERTPRSFGRIDIIRSRDNAITEKPVWPIFLMAAVILHCLERALVAYGGEKWR